MATQQQFAEHLDMSQQRVSTLMAFLGIDWKTASMDDVRIAYIRHLRVAGAGSVDDSLVAERILTEGVSRELKELVLAEKKDTLINVEQLEPELMNMISAFRAELLARDVKLKADLDARYGIDLDLSLLNEYTRAALAQLSRDDDPQGQEQNYPSVG